MDFLTHGAAGAFVAWSWPRRWGVPKATATAVVAALLPDADMFLPDPFNPDATLAHRGITHSLFGVAVLAPLIAILPWGFSKPRRRYWSVAALTGLGMFSHLVLDLPTELGLKIFWPFYPKRVYLDWLSGIDLTLFTASVFVLLAAWTCVKREAVMRRGILSSVLLTLLCCWLFLGWPLIGGRLGASLRTEEPVRSAYPLILGAVLVGLLAVFGRADWRFPENRARFGLFGLSAFSVYLLVCGTAHRAALRRIDSFTREHDIRAFSRTASRLEPSSFIAPVRWTGLVLTQEGVFQAEMSPVGPVAPTFDFYPNAAENEFVSKARTIPEVRRYLADTRFPVSCYEVRGEQHVVEFYDPWWGVGVVRVKLNGRREVVAINWIPVKQYVSEDSFSDVLSSAEEDARNRGPHPPTVPCLLARLQQLH